ncbi:MAG: hypothetical protein SFW67_15270 [Myxococcaceae bacterium]|nr:hypothetical protein [Myxococcaceae bacterium]
MPIHWGAFNLALHAWDEPAETLAKLVTERKVPMVTPRLGAPVELSRVESFDPWWREVTHGTHPVVELPPGERSSA